MVEQATGWAALDTAVLQWMACGGSPALGCAIDARTMRLATLELARRVDAIRDFVADGVGIVGVQSVRVPLAERAAPRMPPAAQTGPEVTVPSHGGGTDGYRCQCAGCVAARHQATIDKAFAPAGYGSALPGVPADPALNMVRWPLDELDWLERRADYLSNQINEFNRRLRTLLRRVRG
jgi:hypothetical protein